MSPSGTSKRRPLGRRGATAVEMALVANGLLLLLIGGIEVGRYCFVSESVHYLVGEVARAAVINPDGPFNKAAFVQRAPILNSERLTLDVNVQQFKAPALSTVTVTASYEHFRPGDQAVGKNEWSSLFQPINATVRLQFVTPCPSCPP